MYVYRFSVAENKLWRTIIKRLRLDPCSTQGALIEVGYVRALP